jgi:hypothetical protein
LGLAVLAVLLHPQQLETMELLVEILHLVLY